MKCNALLMGFLFIFVSCMNDARTSKDEIVLSLGHDMPVKSNRHLALTRFAEILKYKSKGKVKVEIFPEQSLGNDYQMMAKAQRGEIDLIFPPTAKMSSLLPMVKVLDVPYFFKTKQEVYFALDSFLEKMFADALREKGLIGLNIFEGGFKQIISHKSIQEVSDFENLKFRIMKNDILKKQYAMVGSQPIHIDFHQIGAAFKDLSIDAFENPLDSVLSMKLANEKTSVLLTDHAYLGQFLILSREGLKKIPPLYRSLLHEASREAMLYLRELNNKEEEGALKKLKSMGVKVTRPSPALKAQLVQLWEPLMQNVLDEFPILKNREKNLLHKDKPKSLLLGLDLALSGPVGTSGEAIRLGAELALEEINAAGGINGIPLSMEALDNQGFPSKGVKNIKKLILKGNLVAIMGGMHSPVALKEVSMIHEKQVPFLIPWAAATELVDNGYDPNFVFRFSVRDEYAGEFLIKNIRKRAKKIALLLENTSWGKSNHRAMLAAMKRFAMSPVAVEFFNWGQSSFSESLMKIKDSDADGIVFVGNAPEGGAFLREMVKYNMTSIPVVSHWGIVGGDFFQNNKDSLQQIDFSFLQTYFFDKSSKGKAHAFYQKVKKHFPNRVLAPAGIIHAYELTHLLAQALRTLNSFSGIEVYKALKGIQSYHGIFRNYHMPFAKLQEALEYRDFSLARFGADGEIVKAK